MSQTITFVAGANQVVTLPPLYGYTVDLIMPIDWQQGADGTYTAWDNGANSSPVTTFDYRFLRGCRWQLPISQQTALMDFFRDAAKGRGEDIIIRLGNSPTGFFPAGPDLGDMGDFTFRLVDAGQQSAALGAPYLRFEDTLDFVLVSAPAYSLPSPIQQGPFRIGTISGLMYPQGGFKLTASKTYANAITRGGIPWVLDGATSADRWETETTIEGNQPNMAALMAFFQSAIGRAADISVVGSANNYVYGAEQDDAGTYTSKLIQNVLTITHDRFNSFSLPLKFWMKAAA